MKDCAESHDQYDLARFLRAQKGAYGPALAEITQGHKRSHWMWYIFPQIEGLGFSTMSQRYAIRNLAEARAYLDHPVLGPRLVSCVEALLHLENRSAAEIFEFPDDRKLRSCATLFAAASAAGSPFHRLLEKYFEGEPDPATRQRLGE